MTRLFVLCVSSLVFAGCRGEASDVSASDSGSDALDSGAATTDSGPTVFDAGTTDSGTIDTDAGRADAGPAIIDAGFPPITAIACTPDGGARTLHTDPAVTPLFVGGGYGSLIAISNDGLAWETVCELETPGGDDNFLIRSMASGDGKLLAVGGSSTARIMLSYDGLHWADHSVPSKNWLGGVAYGNGVWVGAGGYGLRVWSADGVTWPAANFSFPAPNGAYRALMFGGGKFIAYGDGGRRTLTVDGKVWTNDSFNNPANNIITWLQGAYYAGGKDLVQRSADGISWQDFPDAALGEVRNILHDGTRFYAMTSNGVFTSSTGTAWQALATTGPNPAYMNTTAYGAGRFVGYSYDYNLHRMRAHTSVDGTAWQQQFPLVESTNGFVGYAIRP